LANILQRLAGSYVFGFLLVTIVYVLMLRGLIAAGREMHVARNMVLLMVLLSTVLYALAAAATWYIRRK